jgi:hypothetical protein
MKKQILFLIILLSVFTYQQLSAQEKTKADKDKEIQISIEEQKKAMSEQKKAQEEDMQKLIDEKNGAFKEMNDAQDDYLNSERERTKIFMNIPRGNRSFNFDMPYEITANPEIEFFRHMGDEERTSWDFSKTVKDNTFSGNYSFDVQKTAKSVVMSVMGDCKSGEIRVKIIMPNGKTYSDVLIDESGNLNWRKSFTITDTENKDKAGEWKFQISSAKATGYFKISLQAY